MKNFSIIAFLFLFAFNPFKSKAQNNGAFNPAKQAGCTVRVDFGSPGSGIDLKKYEEIKKLIDGKKLEYKEVPNGREGETYLCLSLKELNKKQKKAFIKELKKTAEGGQLVSVSQS